MEEAIKWIYIDMLGKYEWQMGKTRLIKMIQSEIYGRQLEDNGFDS